MIQLISNYAKVLAAIRHNVFYNHNNNTETLIILGIIFFIILVEVDPPTKQTQHLHRNNSKLLRVEILE